jgi:hypothetical protein
MNSTGSDGKAERRAKKRGKVKRKVEGDASTAQEEKQQHKDKTALNISPIKECNVNTSACNEGTSLKRNRRRKVKTKKTLENPQILLSWVWTMVVLMVT